MFNLVNLKKSDAWDCVREIYDPRTGDIDEQRVVVFCETIMRNTSAGDDDEFWGSGEKNLFKVAVLYTAFMREQALQRLYERHAKELLGKLPYVEEHALLADVYQNGCFPASNGRDFLVFKRHIPPRPEAERAVFVDNNNVETGEITNAICKVTGRNDGYRNMSFVYTAVEDETGPFVEVILCQEQEVYHWVSAAKE